MTTPLFRRSFTAFHMILGLGILWLSARSVILALPATGHHDPHAVALGTVEAIGAVLFLLPWTLRVGAALLLLTICIAAAVHTVGGHWRIDLLIYAAGVWLVSTHRAAPATPAS
ncbi:MAG TPA: hypothetical protein VJQ53_04690 [Candidatus Eisenbacteria bacterium]|nr:hypothetical protein [Candidatus Eisenbacteria bacterium]